MDLMFAPLRRFADFEGRSRRSEFWLFRLFQALAMIALMMVAGLLGREAPTVVGGLFIIFILLMAIPNLSVSIRRLHDTGRSGWWVLIALIPFGGFVLLVFDCLEGDRGRNQYGPDPKASPGDPVVAETFA